jgi:hypothetical protein
MKLDIKYSPLPTQAKIFNDDKTEMVVQSGGLSSGKTYNLVMKALKLSYQNKNYDGGIICPTYADFKKDIIPTIEKIFQENSIRNWKYHQTDKYFNFPWMAKRSRLFVFSGETIPKGPNLAYGLMNEFSTIPKASFYGFLSRIRVDAPVKQKILCGTLEDEYNFLDDFFDKYAKLPDDKFKWHKSHTSENTYIDQNYIDNLKMMYDSQALKVYLSGDYVRIGESYFYYQWSKENIIENKKHDSLITYVGMDFNYAKMSCVFGHKIQDEFCIYDNMFLKGDANTYSICRAIKERYEDWKNFIIICDASGAARKSSALNTAVSDVAILRNEGFTVVFKNQNPRLRKRQLLLNAMMERKKLIVDPICKELIKDFEKVRQKPDYTKDPGKDNSYGHLSDCTDYVVDYLFNPDNNLSRSKISIA